MIFCLGCPFRKGLHLQQICLLLFPSVLMLLFQFERITGPLVAQVARLADDCSGDKGKWGFIIRIFEDSKWKVSLQVSKKLFSEEELAVVRLTSLVVELLHGIADSRPKFTFLENEWVLRFDFESWCFHNNHNSQFRPLPQVFSNVFYDLIESGGRLPWKEVPITVVFLEILFFLIYGQLPSHFLNF